MTSQFYDFTAMAAANPASPPTGLRAWSHNAGTAKIVTGGVTGVSNALTAWVTTNFTANTRYIKMEIITGNAAISSFSNLGLIIGSKEQAGVTTNSKRLLCYFNRSVEQTLTDGLAASSDQYFHNFSYIDFKLTLYIDTVTGIGYPFKDNNVGISRPITGLTGFDLFGFVLGGSTTTVKSFLIQEATAMPFYAGDVKSTSTIDATRQSVQVSNVNNSVAFQGIKPRFCKIGTVDIPVSNILDTQAYFKIDFEKWKGNESFPYTIATQGITKNVYVTLEFSNGVNSLLTESLLQGGFRNAVVTGTPTDLTAPNLNYYYNLSGAGSSIPVNSLIFYATNETSNDNLLTVSTGGVMTIGSVTAPDGALFRTIFVVDAIDKKIRVFRLHFTIASGVASITNVNAIIPDFYQPRTNLGVELDSWIESDVITDADTGGDGATFSAPVQISEYNGSTWSPYVDHVPGTGVAGNATIKIRTKSSNTPLFEKIVTCNLAGDIILTWSIITKMDVAALQTQHYDFASMPISTTPTLPDGLYKWTKDSGSVRIVDQGIAAQTSTLTAVLLRNFITTSSVVKLSFVLGLNAVGNNVNSQGCGIIFTKDEGLASPDNTQGIAMMASVMAVKTLIADSGALGSQGPDGYAQTNYNLAGDLFEVYFDTANRKAVMFKNGVCVFKMLDIPAAYTKMGLVLSITTAAISSLSFSNHGDELPFFIGNNMAASFFPMSGPQTFKYYGMKPKAATMAGIPLRLDDGGPGEVIVRVPDLEFINGNIFNPPSRFNGSGTRVSAEIVFTNILETVKYESLLSGTSTSTTLTAFIVASGGAANVGDSTNLNYYYTPNGGSPAGIPNGSYIFSPQYGSATPNSNLNIQPNGAAILSNLDNNVGTVQRTICIKDAVSGILHVYVADFTKVNGTMIGCSKIYTPEQSYFVSAYNKALRSVVESSVIYLDGGASNISGSEFWVKGNAEVSYDTGSGWSAWSAPTQSNPMEMISSLTLLPIKLRGIAPNISLAVREFELFDNNSFGTVAKWRLGSGVDETPFIPYLAQAPEGVLLDLINHENGTDLNTLQVEVINPTVNNGLKPANTVATLVAKPNGGFNGSMPITYSRINVNEWADGDEDADILVPLDCTWVDLINAFNITYNINLTDNDYEPEPTFPGAVSGDTLWTIRIKPTSLLYYGEVLVEWLLSDTSLVDLLTTWQLNGFLAPINLTPAAMMVNLILQGNPTIPHLTTTRVTFGKPTTNYSGGAANTDVVVRGIPGMGYKDSVLINYTRRTLASLSVGSVTLVIAASTPTFDQVATALNTALGCNLAGSDINAGAALPSLSLTPQSYTIVCNVNCLAFTGSYEVQLQQAT